MSKKGVNLNDIFREMPAFKYLEQVCASGPSPELLKAKEIQEGLKLEMPT